MGDPQFIAVNDIDGVLAFLLSIDWWDPWLVGLIVFHVAITVAALTTRNHSNFQVLLFLILCVLIDENLNWKTYFGIPIQLSLATFALGITNLSERQIMLLVYFSENINEIAASKWNLFSRQQYFDSQGMFISLVFSVPILLNCMIMVAHWLYQSSQLMTKLKTAQLRREIRASKEQRNGAHKALKED